MLRTLFWARRFAKKGTLLYAVMSRAMDIANRRPSLHCWISPSKAAAQLAYIVFGFPVAWGK
jgi:hypothetical protein